MKKILIINDFVVGGGVEGVMKSLIDYIADRDYDVTLLTLYDRKNDFEGLFAPSVKYDSYGYSDKEKHKRLSPLWFFEKFFVHIKRFIKRQKKYDVVFSFKEGASMKEGAKFKGDKKFAFMHADYQNLYWTKFCFKTPTQEINCMKKYDWVLCVTQSVKKSVLSIIGDPENLRVKHVPVDVDSIIKKGSEKISELTEALKVRKERPLLVSVGRLHEQKGYERLLRACARLNEHYDYDMWIVGDGPERERLEAIIDEEGLENVRLWGHRANPYPFMRAADLFVSSSLGESYGLVIQESLMLGVPVLGATCPAFEETVGEGEALLVPNSYEGLLEGISDYLEGKVTLFPDMNSRTHEKMFDQRLSEFEALWS